jgi:hypothetical protein
MGQCLEKQEDHGLVINYLFDRHLPHYRKNLASIVVDVLLDVYQL